MIQLGDMIVVGNPPAKLWKALAVIADQLHSGFDLQPGLKPRISRESCVLCSLTVRDFLRRLGFAARVCPVFVEIYAFRDGISVHGLGIGHPTDERKSGGGRWTGHMVVEVGEFLIDTTLYQARRPQWWPELSGMMVVPKEKSNGAPPLTRIAGLRYQVDIREFNIDWFDNPANNKWRRGPDARDRNRRRPIVERLVEHFGRWDEMEAETHHETRHTAYSIAQR